MKKHAGIAPRIIGTIHPASHAGERVPNRGVHAAEIPGAASSRSHIVKGPAKYTQGGTIARLVRDEYPPSSTIAPGGMRSAHSGQTTSAVNGSASPAGTPI